MSYMLKLRGKPGIDVSKKIAQEFGGGGHERQAAFQFKRQSKSIAKLLIPKAVDFIKKFE